MENKKTRQHTKHEAFNWRNRYVAFLCTYFSVVGILLLVDTIIIPRKIPPQGQPPESQRGESWQEQAKLITVKVVSGEFWGSGILIAKKGNIYRVLTNAHVLSKDIKSYPIHTPDGKIYQGVVIASASEFDGDDLAILEFVSNSKNYQLARLGKTPQPGDKVLAVGFPFPQLDEKVEGIVFHQGTVWRLLNKPLQGGYQLGYTNEIKKGMSGGPLLNQAGEVIAVNGMHAYPLLGKPYIYKDGTIPEQALVEEMVRHSWGIPISRIKNLGVMQRQ